MINPIDYFNTNYDWSYVMHQLPNVVKSKDKGVWSSKPGYDDLKEVDDTYVQVIAEGATGAEIGTKFSKFGLFTKLKFHDNWSACAGWISHRLLGHEIPYVRIGSDYYKKVWESSRWGGGAIHLKPWKKETIKDDNGKRYIHDIPKFDSFVMHPDNVDYQPVVDSNYNLYKPFPHEPKQGDFPVTKQLMNHVFGDQVELGYKYLQVLYLHPTQILPILILVSRERQTGKSTFLNYMSMMFGENYALITPEVLLSSFNGAYAKANIIAVDELMIDKQAGVEKIKSIGTAKQMFINDKYVNSYSIPFYGKLIMCSNKEYDFMRIDQEEIRFWMRKLKTIETINTSIEKDLFNEIPAMLHHLNTLPPVDFSKSRMVFTAEEIRNKELEKTKEQSRSNLYQEIIELVSEWFDRIEVEELRVTPSQIKQQWFQYNSNISAAYIRKVLKNEFEMDTEDMQRFIPFDGDTDSKIPPKSVPGKPFVFKRGDFTEKFLQENGSIPF
jgi:hypothetical protein